MKFDQKREKEQRSGLSVRSESQGAVEDFFDLAFAATIKTCSFSWPVYSSLSLVESLSFSWYCIRREFVISWKPIWLFQAEARSILRGVHHMKLTMHILPSSDSNEAKIYLAFGYCLPTTLLISHVKTAVSNHWSGEVGRSGPRLHRIFTWISEEISVWKCFDTPKLRRTFLKANFPTLRVHWHLCNSLKAVS